MGRAIWSGAVSFGLVNVPVKAYTAVRDHEVRFHQLERETSARVRHQKVSEKTGEQVDSDDIVSGYEISPGRYVAMEPDELDELRPKTTRTIDVADFVALADIDPVYYERTYWLAPDGEAAAHAYRLLAAAMESEQRVGIGTVVMRTKQYLAAVRPLDGALAMSTMRFADEVLPRSSVEQIPHRSVKADPKEMKLAGQIIDPLTTDWDPGRYHDTYTEELKKVLKAKAAGKTITAEEATAATSNVVDLMDALQASVEAAKQARSGHGAGRAVKGATKSRVGSGPARKPAAARPRTRKSA
jgi:DNA end-binding protein Ku